MLHVYVIVKIKFLSLSLSLSFSLSLTFFLSRTLSLTQLSLSPSGFSQKDSGWIRQGSGFSQRVSGWSLQVHCVVKHPIPGKNWCFDLKTGQFYGLPTLKTDGSPSP